jgi:signal transduction histidine kinase
MVTLLDGSRWFIPRGMAVLFVAALLAVILDAFLFFYVITSVADNAREIQAARTQIDQLVAIRDILQDAETSQRGYLLTGREEYLEPYLEVLRKFDTVVGQLTTNEALPPDERARFGELRQLAEAKLRELQQTIDLYRNGARGDALGIVQSDVGRQIMGRIRVQIDERQAAVQRRQDEMRLARARIFQWGLLANVAVAAVAAALLLGFGILIVHHLLRREQFERGLQRTNVALERAVAERTEELATLSHHLLTVREEEKSALARELHDGLGSSLTAARMDLAAARAANGDTEVRAALDSSMDALDVAIAQQRSALHGLHPRLLDTMGLRAALESYVADFNRRTGIHAEIGVADGLNRLDEARAITLFRIAQEALTNVAKHARANKVSVELTRALDTITLAVRDNGVGFDPAAARRRKSLGLVSMRERARQFQGVCSIGPVAAGGPGTEIRVTIRVDGAAAQKL